LDTPVVTGEGEVSTDQALTAEVLAAARSAGLAAAGVALVEPFTATRRHLYERREAGLHGGMAFTYRNPDRSTDPGRILAGARTLVVGAFSYARRPPDAPQTPVAPARVARYAWSDVYGELHQALAAGAARLRGAGYRAVIVADQNSLVDREAARRAGLGWYGRNANLLLPGQGSWFVLGSVVTDAPLVPSEPVAPGCGSCTRCLGSCPTGAIVASGVVDARRCLAWLLQRQGPFPREWRVALGDRMYGCDDCQEVCPPNVVTLTRRKLPAAPEGARAVVDAAEFLGADDAAVMAAAGRWYVADRDPRYLRRNALIVLGNAADPGDPRVIGVLTRYLADPDPLLRGHAVWAAARLGRAELADAIWATEADPMVREELERRPEVPRRGA
jgi:epoxyqueuosine reductase